nr:MAG TPA: hypothetical protein [Caudoviricetes sp.]
MIFNKLFLLFLYIFYFFLISNIHQFSFLMFQL